MMVREKAVLVVLLVLLASPCNFGGALQPEFLASMTNLTVPFGRDATFTCLVGHLGGYRVGWVKADTKAIQAIHDHVITHNPRISVSHGDHSTWSLHIKGVQLEDAGLYMCQVNTDPMKSQTAVLSVEVSPDFVSEETSGDVTVGEGGQVTLRCRAKGLPPPHVTWRREDGKNIVISNPSGANTPNKKTRISATTTTSKYEGEVLKLQKVSRNEMGAYLCIASNGVRPAISKRIIVNVHFPPIIHVPNQLVGAPLGTDVTLECFVEASPKSINYWVKDNGTMIISSTRYDVQMVMKSVFEVWMTLTVRNLQHRDVGSYCCTAKNSLGGVESSIRLYEIAGSTKTQTAAWPPFYDKEDEGVSDSAEAEDMENKPFSMDNTIYGQIRNGYPLVSTPTPTITITKKQPIVNVGSSSDSKRSQIHFDLIIVAFTTFNFIRW